MDSLQKALSDKGFDDLQIQMILETVSDSLKINKELAVFNPATQKLQLLSETTLDYTLPVNMSC